METLQYVFPWSEDRGDVVAVRAPEGTLTFLELEERARRVANGLACRGIGEGGSFGLLARNRLEWPELVIGNVRAHSCYVPLNWHLTASEVAELLVDSGATLLIVGPEDEQVGREAAAIAGVTDIITLGPEYEEWLSAQSDAPLPDGPVGRPLLYTGGTTGRSKGVMRSDMQIDVSAYASGASRYGDHVAMPLDGRALLITPAYHALGFSLIQTSLARGHSLHISAKFDPVEALRLIDEWKITTTSMVPTQFIRLLKLPEEQRTGFDLSSLQWVLHTAAPCPKWVKYAMIDWFGPVIIELYGSSEGTGPVICTSEDWLAHPGSVGKASPALTLSIVDDEGNDLPPGEIGTIYVLRVDGTPTYHGDPEKTSSIQLPDGRFTVGDIGWLDEDGFLYLADRRTDLIIRGGTNIYPAEVEATLSEHEGVADVAVFGIPDEEFGQSVMAVIQPSDGSDVATLADDIRGFADTRLARFRVPSTIEFRDELPREASGKLKKRLLRDPYWE